MNTFTCDGETVIEIRTEGNKETGPNTESVCECPRCGKPKLNVNNVTGVFRCWSAKCGFSGKAEEFWEENGNGSPPPARPKKREIEVDADTRSKYIQKFLSSLIVNEHVYSYLSSHGLPKSFAKKFHIGYSKNKPEFEDEAIAKQLGFLNERGNNRFYKRVMFPVWSGGKYTYLQGRRTEKGNTAKFINMHGTAPMFNEDVLGSKELYITEGIADALALINHKIKNVIGLLGASNKLEECAERIAKSGTKKVILCFDGDEAGMSATLDVTELLEQRDIQVTRADIPADKDVSAYLRDGGELSEIEIKAEGSEVNETVHVVGNPANREKVLTYLRSEQNLLIFGYGDIGKVRDFDITINVSNVVEKKTSLKATIQFVFKDNNNYSGQVDIASIRSRATFAKEISEHFKFDEKETKIILNDLNTGVREQVEVRKEEKVRKKDYVMSEEEKAEAIKLLKTDKLLFHIKEALTAQNIIGEDVNKILLYLIFTSRIMKQPISCIIKGLSSSGKTHLMKQTMTLMPQEALFVIQDATAKAFHYLEEDGLKHKMVVIGEMHGSEDSSYTIREAQDGVGSGNLKIITVEKDVDTNQMKTVERTVEGPCGFVTSTTNPELHAENETRNFSIYVQVNKEKVRNTGIVTINKYTNQDTSLNEENLLVYHNAQRCLEAGIKVMIPYVAFLIEHFPLEPVRVMRDRKRFFTIIETIALLHQHQREVYEDEKGERFINATVSDYYCSRVLLDEILVETLYELPPKSKEMHELVLDMKREHEALYPPDQTINFDPDNEDITERKDFYVTYKEIGERMGMKPRDVRRWAKTLFEGGYFVHHDTGGVGRGRETHIVPTGKEFYQKFLPSPEELLAHLGETSADIYDPITGETKTIQAASSGDESPGGTLSAEHKTDATGQREPSIGTGSTTTAVSDRAREVMDWLGMGEEDTA